MVYDRARDRLLIYGGSSPFEYPGDPPIENDLWEFSIPSAIWRVTASPDPVRPSPLARAPMILDDSLDRLWIFSGQGVFEGPRRGIWKLDLGSMQSSDLPLELDDPISRVDHVTVGETETRGVLMFGGSKKGEGSINTADKIRDLTVVWRFDLDTEEWTQLTNGLDRPVQDEAVGAYDPLSRLLLVFGGDGGETVGPYPHYESDEVWAFDAGRTAWSVASPQGALTHRRFAAGAYCPCLGKLLIIGGRTSFYDTYPTPEEYAFLIPIEHPAEFTWDSAAQSIRRRSPWRWGTLECGDLEASGFEEGTVRLVDCESGETLQYAEDFKRLGRARWHLRFSTPGEETREVEAKGRLVITGRPLGEVVNVMARVPPLSLLAGPSECTSAMLRTQVELHDPSHGQLEIELDQDGWRIRFSARAGSEAKFRIYDVSGRLRYQDRIPASAGPSKSQYILDWDGRDSSGRRLPTGLYLVRAVAGQAVATGKIFLR